MTSSTIEYRDSMTQSLKLDDDVIKDPFDSGLITYDPNSDFEPVVASRDLLRRLSRDQVLIRRWPKPLRFQFYRNLVAEVAVAMCDSCFRVSDVISNDVITV